MPPKKGKRGLNKGDKLDKQKTSSTAQQVQKLERISSKKNAVLIDDRTPQEATGYESIYNDKRELHSAQPPFNSMEKLLLLHNCTGDFEEDFPILCRLQNMEVVPPVVPRPRVQEPPQRGSSLRKSPSFNRKKSMAIKSVQLKKRVSAFFNRFGPSDNQETGGLKAEESCELFNDAPSSEFLPTTFIVKDKFQCLKPCVQVDYRLADHTSHSKREVTEVYIRGWKIDVVMMEILKQCFLAMEHLKLLQLWNAGLTAHTVGTLAWILPRCRCLSSLILDANSLGGHCNVSDLISEHSPLEHLSLRFCGIDDLNALGIGTNLGTLHSWNRKLVTLNLSNNKITDVGVRHIAGGLKTNRTLLVLNLASNQIGDEGAEALAEVLSHFPLEHEQMTFRRKILSQKDAFAIINADTQAPSTPSSQMDLSGGERNRDSFLKRKDKASHSLEKEKKKKAKATDSTEKPTAKLRRGSMKPTREVDLFASKELASVTTGAKGKSKEMKSSPSSKEGSRKRNKIPKRSAVTPPLTVEWHPLMEAGRLDEDGQFQIVGNCSLVSLNLARNRIGEKGLKFLLDMVQAQSSLCPDFQEQEQQQRHRPSQPSYRFTGLKRLVIHKNNVPMDNEVLMKIQSHMLIKDPMHRMPLLTLHRDNVPPCAMPPIKM